MIGGQGACLKVNDQITLQATSASQIQFQATLVVELNQAAVEQFLALDEPVIHRAIAFDHAEIREEMPLLWIWPYSLYREITNTDRGIAAHIPARMEVLDHSAHSHPGAGNQALIRTFSHPSGKKW